MVLNLPGVVLSLLLGSLIGALVAFFRARAVKEVFNLIGLGMGGFLLGQLGQLLWQTPWLRVGTVDILLGVIGVVVLMGGWIAWRSGTAH